MYNFEVNTDEAFFYFFILFFSVEMLRNFAIFRLLNITLLRQKQTAKINLGKKKAELQIKFISAIENII